MSLYRASIALNNTGVSLLEQRAYRQAIDTFKDAIQVMRLVFTSDNNSNYNSDDGSASVQDKLDRASKRLAQPRPLTKCPSLDLACLDDANVHSMWKEAAAAGMSSCLPSSQTYSSSTAFPIRLAGLGGGGDLDVESAMMLYNFGLSYLCLARFFSRRKTNNSSSNKGSKDVLQQALKLFYMAYSTLSNHTVQGADGGDVPLATSLLDGRLSLSIVILHAIVQVELELGNHKLASRRYQKLMQVTAFLQQHDAQSPVDQMAAGGLRAAAAA